MIEVNLATPIFLGRWLTLNPIALPTLDKGFFNL